VKFTLASQFRSPACPRERAVERWALRHLGILEHERRVRDVLVCRGMTVQIAGPIGPFLDSVQARQVDVMVMATCDVDLSPRRYVVAWTGSAER